MRAKLLAQILPGAEVSGGGDVDICGVTYDSRKVQNGWLFAALRGNATDGHRFISQAVKAGASALLVEDAVPPEAAAGAAVIRVPDSRKAMAAAAAAVYGYPTRDLLVFAVTGTNGKTSTTHLIASILKKAGLKPGIIGTLGAMIGDDWVSVPHTTPESSDLQELFARMRDAGVKAVAMEASSHAIAQSRMDGVEVDTAVFTNLTQDHLDFHRTMEAYFGVKAELFTRFADGTKKSFTSVVNLDDPWGRERLAPIAHGQVITYGMAPDAVCHACTPRSGPSGICFALQCPSGSCKVHLRLGGLFNVHNALAAAAACLGRGIPLEAVREGLEAVPGVPGRFELVHAGQDFTVVVDYAHTPDGLENVLASARKLTLGRVIAVFGCGGDRDRGKRPIMGGIASRMADVPVLTSDNPRTEKPEDIARDVIQGIPAAERDKVLVELDRREAIRLACREATAGDVVVIAGKGHETYQIFADRTIDFDDRQVVREVLGGESGTGEEGASC